MDEIPNEIDEAFMTMAQVAALWNCSVDTVRRRVKSGALPSIQAGRGVRIAREDALKGAQ
ncbi:helix-turn-helix domain-containing protein [Mycobacterium sp. D16Q16]|uniref:helix-turn-helix domain-containing protein n=1 Tax=Mycobacterium sp. D16Q16 TaxID=1855659 RepID=UPI00099329CD|nr:helix-turn-helix domain-containing protein [Mycobacterium sp. D16Q16]